MNDRTKSAKGKTRTQRERIPDEDRKSSRADSTTRERDDSRRDRESRDGASSREDTRGDASSSDRRDDDRRESRDRQRDDRDRRDDRDQSRGGGGGYDPKADEVLFRRVTKADRGRRFCVEVRRYEGSAPRIEVSREFWGDRTGRWMTDFRSRGRVDVPAYLVLLDAQRDIEKALDGERLTDDPDDGERNRRDRHEDAPRRDGDDIPF